MRRLTLTLFIILATVCSATAQGLLPARANVTAYADDDGVAKLAYRESPYYMALTGSWWQRQTDSSIIYERQLDVDKLWREYRVTLNVRCGMACHVALNGHEVGYGDDTRQWNEFLLDKHLKYGKANTLAIEVLKNAQGALLEDGKHTIGLNGEPFLRFKSITEIQDFTIDADYDATTGVGSLSIAAQIFNPNRKGRYYVEAEICDANGRQIDRIGRWVIFDKREAETIDLERTWNNVTPWNAEQPVLYTAILHLRNEKMNEEEVVGARFGFRRVEVADGVLKINGQPITIKGVTYGIEHTEGSAAREQMRRDVIAMKSNNLNAVRTSRHSPMDAYFYELCDQYGLYVVADANLMPHSSRDNVVATNKEYIPLFEQRTNHLYGSLKNHSSIVAWSLGNTRDNGICMTAAYRRLKSLEKHRPVIMPCAEQGENTDIIAPVLPDANNLRLALGKEQERPFVMLSMVDTTGFANIAQLWQLCEQRRNLQGGFIDIWPLQGTMADEVQHLFCPFSVSILKLSPDEAEFAIHNRSDFASLGKYSIEYTIYTNLRPNIVGGELVATAAGGESDRVQVRIPVLDLQAGEELFIRFDLLRRTTGIPQWQKALGRKAGTVVFALPHKKAAKRKLDNSGRPFASATTQPTLPVGTLCFVGHNDWQHTVVDSKAQLVDPRTMCFDELLQYTSADGNTVCDVRRTTTCYSTGDQVVEYTIAPTSATKGALQPAIYMPATEDSLSWFGLDREVLLDENNCGIVGNHTASRTNMQRKEVRWCSLHGGGKGMVVRDIDNLAAISVSGTTLCIMPPATSTFRIHMLRYEGAMPTTFMGTEYPSVAQAMAQPPQITASETRFSQPMLISLAANGAGIIRYTTDGTDPTASSAAYTAPFQITTTTTVRARLFPPDAPPSFCATRHFNFDYIAATTFSRKANTPYNKGVDTLLFDGEQASIDDMSHGWLGYSGQPATITVELGRNIDIGHVLLRFAHSPQTWAFAPQSVTLSFSADGIAFDSDTTYTLPFDPADSLQANARVVSIDVAATRSNVRYVRITPTTIDRLPPWHRGKGLKPWLLTDELGIVEQTTPQHE